MNLGIWIQTEDIYRKDKSMFHRHPMNGGRDNGRKREGQRGSKRDREAQKQRQKNLARNTLYLMPNTKKGKSAFHPEGKDTQGQSQISDVRKHQQQAKGKLQGQKVSLVR